MVLLFVLSSLNYPMWSKITPSADQSNGDDGAQWSNASVERTSDSRYQQHKSMWTSLRNSLDSDNSPDVAVFKLKQGDTSMPTFISAWSSVFYGLRIVVVALSPDIPLFLQVASYIRILVVILSWTYAYLLKKYEHAGVLSKEGRRIIQVGNAVMILQAICSGLLLISLVVTSDECQSEACLQDTPKQTIPMKVIFQHVIGSMIMPLFFTCHDVSTCLLSICIAFSLLKWLLAFYKTFHCWTLYILVSWVQ